MRIQLFAAVLPLVLFWAIEKYLGLKAALIASCIAAPIEIILEYVASKKVSFVTWVSNALVIGLGALSYYTDSGAFFKLQPMFMELGMGIAMVGVRFKGGEPFMIRMFRDNPALKPEQRDMAMNNPIFMTRFRQFDTRLIAFLFVHGLAVGWAAIWGSSDLWILLKGVLFYVMLVLVVLPMYKKPRGTPPIEPIQS